MQRTQPTIATVGNNAAMMHDPTRLTQPHCPTQRMQQTLATVGNNAATLPDVTDANQQQQRLEQRSQLQDATNATNKATVRNNAATLQDATNAPT